MNKKYILVTGAAGFIGYFTCKRLINEKNNVIGIDNINSYYDVNLKNTRIKDLKNTSLKNGNKLEFIKLNLEDNFKLNKVFDKYRPEIVIHLAAQAGVRYSLINPKAYIESNILGFFNILECCRNFGVNHLLYASSSSVYGGNKKLPFCETDSVDSPSSLYAATKKSNEIIANSYSHLFDIPMTGMRFFTVYGPLGRPDMAPMIFADAIMNNKPIKIFNYGKMKRDFTFIDDIVECIIRCSLKTPTKDLILKNFPNQSLNLNAPHKILNFGNSSPIQLMDFVEILERALNKKAIKEYLPIQQGDVEETEASVKNLQKWIDFIPKTTLKEGIQIFAEWFIRYTKNEA
jgi:UDP-glucuronate 4-epimerase